MIDLHASLKEILGFDHFKGDQEAIIRSLLDGYDTFVIMPTGGGKSLCYQLPAMMCEGTAIVVSPLIALMKNQVDAVRYTSGSNCVAHFLNSSLARAQVAEVKEDLLICADFPIDKPSMEDPSKALTDIFKLKPPTTIRESWGGNQTSISSSEGIGAIQDSVAMGTAGGRKLMVPLSTKREAEKLCIEYISRKASNDKAFKLSEPRVKGLIYVPFEIVDGKVVNQGFGNAMPDRMSRFNTQTDLIIG